MKNKNVDAYAIHLREKIKGNGHAAIARRPPEFVQTPQAAALSAIVRNANAIGDGQTEVFVTRLSDTLEEDSALFFNYSYRFLALNKCPGDARDIVLVIVALCKGRFDKYHKIEQQEMAVFMGVSVKTVQRKLVALERWECEIKRAIVDIQKRDRSKGNHYGTTMYRPTIAAYVGEFMRRVTTGARSNGFEERAFTEQTQKFLRAVKEGQASLLEGADLSAFERTDEKAIAEEIREGMPKVDPVKQRRAKARTQERESEERERSAEAEELQAQAIILKKQVKSLETKARKLSPRVTSNKLEALGSARRRMMNAFDDWIELLHQNHFDLREGLQELQTELGEVIARYDEAYGGT